MTDARRTARPGWLAETLTALPNADRVAAEALRARIAGVLRPSGALSRLDEVAIHIAAWQRTPSPHVSRPAALVFAADHGVTTAGVSAYPAAVTASMLEAFRQGMATINVLAASAGASVHAVDVGVGRPTGDIRIEPALTPERAAEIEVAAAAAVESLECDLLVLGEMGIGNTTAAAAVSAALCGGNPEDWVGRGTGVDDSAFAAKRAAVGEAVRRIAGIDDPLEILRQVGGAELLAMAAACVAARLRSIPVVLDGYVVTASVTALAEVTPGALDHCLAGHRSAEPGHGRLLERLGLRPLLDLGLRLGEGSGAMAAVPLIAMACAAATGVPTFAEWADR